MNKLTRMMAALLVLLMMGMHSFAQELHSRWDELTASEWPKALEMSNQTCILPIGILETWSSRTDWV